MANNLLMDGTTRPSDIQYNNTAVNEVYYNDTLVWKRSTTDTVSTTTYLSAKSKVTWASSDTSSENASYAYSSSTTGTGELSIDFSSIPSNATITSATITWNYGRSESTTPYRYDSWSSDVYWNDTDTGASISNKTATITNLLTPGVANTMKISYKRTGASFTTNSSNSTLSTTSTMTLSEITCSVTYYV